MILICLLQAYTGSGDGIALNIIRICFSHLQFQPLVLLQDFIQLNRIPILLLIQLVQAGLRSAFPLRRGEVRPKGDQIPEHDGEATAVPSRMKSRKIRGPDGCKKISEFTQKCVDFL